MAASAAVTFADLEPLLAGHDPEGVRAFFVGMDEPTRRSLAGAVKRWIRDEIQHDRDDYMNRMRRQAGSNDAETHEQRRSRIEGERLDRQRRSWSEAIALLATSTQAELEKRSRTARASIYEQTLGALVDRRPEWCADHVDFLIERDPGSISWAAVVELVWADLIAVPSAPGLSELMVSSRARWGEHEELFDRLRQQWAIAEAPTWGMFRTATPSLGDPSHALVDGRLRNIGDIWPGALMGLCSSGELDRDRLLDAVLEGLLRDDFRPKQLRWFLGLLELMEPTTDELAVRQPALVALLSVALPTTVSMAIGRLAEIGARRFDDAGDVLHGLVAAASARTKDAAMRALDLAATTLDEQRDVPGMTDGIMEVAIMALSHANGAVRRKALVVASSCIGVDPSVTERWAVELDDVVRALPASEAPRVRRTLHLEYGGEPDQSAEDHAEAPLDPATLETLSATARELSGVDAAFAAWETDASPPPPVAPLAPTHEPAMLGAVLEPVADVDQLAGIIGHALEHGGHGEHWISIELSLDGLSRLGLELRELGTRYDALLRQADLVIDRWDWSASVTLARVIKRQATGSSRGADEHGVHGLDDLVRARAQEVGSRLAAGEVGALLSVPSHQHGWITPTVLVDRVNAWTAANPPTDCDLLCALLRLHSVGREEARARLLPDGGALSTAVAHALGADVPWPTSYDHLRFAGEDTRMRLEEPNWCRERAADALRRAQEPGGGRSSPGAHRHVDRDRPNTNAHLTEVSIHTERVDDLILASDSWGRWPLSVVPGYSDMVGLPAFASALRWGSSVPAELLLPLFDPGQPIGAILCYLLPLSLSDAEPATRILARDLYVSLIDDGRFEPVREGTTLAWLVTNGFVKLNRVVEGLQQVTLGGDLRADDVCRLIDDLIGRLDRPPSLAHQLLELSYEVHLLVGRAVEGDATRAVLASWSSGGSQRARLARELLARQPEPSRVRSRAARARVVSRLERARQIDARLTLDER